ncbi:unnamed protein product [Porites lobata]|uniref:Sushi domain-containing protein n=1 Tax=Porites lobata TaxID=104759 RepID=A0ABN8QA10_9CNID|nr:unnamed protein product [Porites lobata]
MFKGVVFLACLVTCCCAQVPCHAGFFGSKGQACRECPHNTYKDYIGFASSCKPCPVNSGHNLLGSHIFSDCKCLKGYSGDPMQDIPCTIRLCDPFAPPINGSIVGVCNSEYNSVCRIKCNEGYELEGGSAHAEKKCILNENNHMEWTGGLIYCSGKIKVM